MTSIAFDEPRCLRDRIRPAGGEWGRWFDGLDRSPAYACLWSGPEVSGYASAPRRIAGYFVEPLDSVVSLRPFDDAIEGTVALEEAEAPVPYAFFEVEKLVRMMLHQSGLAFEILASPGWLRVHDEEEPCSAARSVVEWAASADLLAHYREVAAPLLEGELDDRSGDGERSMEEMFEAVREVGIGAALAEGRACLDLERLAADAGYALPGDADGHREARASLLEAARRFAEVLSGPADGLADAPRGYDELDAWLVEMRLSVGADRSQGREP